MIVTTAEGDIRYHPKWNVPLIKETRTRTTVHYALPRTLAQLATDVEAAGPWVVRTFLEDPNGRGLLIKCCKCGRLLNGPLDPTNPLSPLVPFNHYCESVYAAVAKEGDDKPLRQYTVLHCKDCVLADEDAAIALAIHTGSYQYYRDWLASRGTPVSGPNRWAMQWAQWAPYEPMGLVVSGRTLTELLAEVPPVIERLPDEFDPDLDVRL